MKLGGIFEQLLNSKFPGLLEENVAGTPVVVALFNEDGSITRAEKFISPEPTIESVKVSKATFAVLGLDEESVPYIGNLGMRDSIDPSKSLLIVYTEAAKPGERFVSKVFPDTRAVDRAIFESAFPAAAKNGVPAGRGLVGATGSRGSRAAQRPGTDRPTAVEPHARVAIPWHQDRQGLTVTPITDAAGEPIKDQGGKDLHLHSVWLAPDSPPPAA